MFLSSLFSLSMFAFAHVVPTSAFVHGGSAEGVVSKPLLETRASADDAYPGLNQLKDASAKFGTALESLKAYNGDLGSAQAFFQQSLEAIQLLDAATKDLADHPAINFITAFSYTSIATTFFGQARDLSNTLVSKKTVLIANGWGDNSYQLLDSLYSSSSNLLKTYFSKRGDLYEWAATPWQNSISGEIGTAREAFRNTNAVITSTVIVYQPAPTAPPAGYNAPPYNPPPQFEPEPQNQPGQYNSNPYQQQSDEQ